MENSALMSARPRPRPKSQNNDPSPCGPMLARRVIQMDDYVAELREDKQDVAKRLKRELGVRFAPIPVPLEPGETEEEYEQRYLATNSLYSKTTGQRVSQTGERASRFVFAMRVAQAYEARQKRTPPIVDTTGSTKKELAMESTSATSPPSKKKEHIHKAAASAVSTKSPAHVRNTKRIVELEQFRRDHKTGVFSAYKTMATDEKMARFGIPIVPIFVPLARGETLQQYEDRFKDWLNAKYKTTLEALSKPRWYWMQFAVLNGKGVETYDPVRFPKRKRVDASGDNREEKEDSVHEPSRKRLRQDETKPTTACCVSNQTSLAACTQCRCDACLLRGMMLLSEKISSLATKCCCPKPKPKRPRDIVVLDLTSDDDEASSSTKTPSQDALERTLKMTPDNVEEKLQNDYDLLNEQILLNQEALDASVAQLALDPPIDMAEMTQLHEENEEVRELIQEECGNRTRALALLVLYQWRHDRDGLERMLRDPNASDVVHVQQLSYRKCVAHASAIATAKQQCALLEQQIEDSWAATNNDKTVSLQHLQGELSVAHEHLQELYYQRRHECTVLVHFDSHLQHLLEVLMGRVHA